ncbi:acyl-CoA dehydrogenase family protein [Microbacterium resistens]|uniref:acyl-CoA dehydrogenase family protein n=1 Tax=Microbacterium resistens TaxID=156977 RepID=UPI00082A6BBD|nr:acyl-CoA dehydrogenase family protein [Microbacterium resistens]
MDVAWGEDYDVLADVGRAAFSRCSPLEDRASRLSFEEQVAQFADLGWLQLGDPTGADEDRAPLGTIAAIFTEMGRALVDGPLLDLMTARDASLAAGTADARELADRIGDGATIVVPVFSSADWGEHVSVRDGALSGTALAVGFADRAHAFLVHARGAENVLARVPSGDSVEVEAMPNLGERPLFAVRFSNTPLASEDVLARGAGADAAVELADARAAVLRAAQVVGAGQRLLEITVRYARERHQFGGPIGRFQAVQYLCTDIALAVHRTSVHVRSTARALDAGEDVQPHLGLLRRQAARTAQVMVHGAHEVHAGIGFMVESSVHLFTNAAKRWQFDFGSDARNEADVVSALDRRWAESAA